MENKRYRLTEDKVHELEQELAYLEKEGRKEIADSLNSLRELPNNLEDVTFSDVLEDKRYLEKRILELKEILSNFELVTESKSANIVEVGSNVKVGFEGYEQNYFIVSALEADPLNNKISDESPVGRALLGSKVGDRVVVDTGIVKKSFRVLDIN